MMCELVQAGIGGSTLAELSRNMSASEFAIWQAYREKHGTFNSNMRSDRGFAMLAMLYSQVHGKKDKKVSIYDFLPHEKAPAVVFGNNDDWDSGAL